MGKLRHDLLLYLDHLLELAGKQDGHRGVHAHAARVEAAVAVERALVVLGGREGHDGLAVRESQKRALRTLEHLLDHDEGARVAERGEALVDAVEGLLGGLRNDDALAGSEAIGLDDDGAADLAHVLRTSGLVRERLVPGRGDAGSLHDVLGELLRALHLRGLAAGPEDGNALRTHGIGHAGDERCLGTYHHEADAILAGEACDRRRVVLVHVRLLGELVHAAVARRHEQPTGARGLGELDQHGVLAPAGT